MPKGAFSIVRGGRLLDIESRSLPPSDILIEGDTIVDVGPPGLQAPARAEVFDAGDKAIMPGLVDGMAAVEAACTAALRDGVHSSDVILNILARLRQLAPPAAIPTPGALRLRHEPAADCARYDSLRRAADGTP